MAGVATRDGGEIRMEEPDVSSSGQEAVEPQSEIKKQLFEAAMESNWEKLVQMYKENNLVPIAINRREDTILHLAISIGEQDGVIELMNLMMNLMDADFLRKILETKNEMGDAPMHQAAFLGMDKVCSFMAQLCPEQVLQARNRQGETPLHVAVLHGRKKAFFALQKVIDAQDRQQSKATTRNNAGDTILHAAISREHFDLAWEIIQACPIDARPQLMNSVNKKGQSALHILATKPSAFRSGTELSIIETLIYNRLPPFELQLEYSTYKEKKGLQSVGDEIKIAVSKAKGQGDQADQVVTIEQNNPGSKDERGLLLGFRECCMVLAFGRTPGDWNITKIKKKMEEKKRKNKYAYKIMEELVTKSTGLLFDIGGRKPAKSIKQEPDIGNQYGEKGKTVAYPEEPEGVPFYGQAFHRRTKELHRGFFQVLRFRNNNVPANRIASPLLMAAKRGVIEMVKKILEHSPASILEVDSHGKNIILLAAEYGQTDIYKYMLKKYTTIPKEALFGREDEDGNSALHLAASLVEKRSSGISGEATFTPKRTWSIPGNAFQMHAEVKWYKYVERSMQPNIFMHYNFKGETAQEIFTRHHQNMIKEAKDWLTSTSGSCSLIAALIATVAYTSANTVPGSFNQETGLPIFKGEAAFLIFAVSSLFAFAFSVTALVCFLSIVTSRFHELDFEFELPRMLLIGLHSLFWSIVTNVISFCAGNFYIIHDKLKFLAYILYLCLALPLLIGTFVALYHLGDDLAKGILRRRPTLSGKRYF